MAGLWESPLEENLLPTFTILTTTPNDLVATFHHRMPVILPKRHWDLWLNPTQGDAPSLTALLQPYPADALRAIRVSRYVNRPANDDARCIAAETDQLPQRLQGQNHDQQRPGRSDTMNASDTRRDK